MFSDTTLNRIYDRGGSVYNYSLGGEGFTNELTRFLNAEIECLKDELAHLQVKHDSVARSSISKVEVFIDKIENGVPLETASDFLADTIDVIFKNGEIGGRIKELKFRDTNERREPKYRLNNQN